ncbi:hypothetical protein CSHISOI_07869 [Colletotrichum shisoi]|uniref:Aminoglycoside phosphotransferase domain-containing protein n=1 Tax=Colletotrichum shisoi TaxID=2078593 RepID=A0A5Q4BLA8_9PEZI|nr:hypothetical protein CSHISOI_07869 [Colletotrichum shisoi]
MTTLHRAETTFAISEFKTYNFTSNTFIKRERPLTERGVNRSGQPVTDPWLGQRFTNEAKALQLIRDFTNIPVPKVVSYGNDQDGLWYLETELITKSVRCDMAGDSCRMPHLHNTHSGYCLQCATIAKNNADNFVRETVLPQLRALTSNTTGLEGFVNPPGWVLEYDKRQEWPVKKSVTRDFVFCHHDLTSYNILLDWQTLDVKAVIDWEDCGFFPPEIQQWKYTRAERFELFEDTALVQKHISLILPE